MTKTQLKSPLIALFVFGTVIITSLVYFNESSEPYLQGQVETTVINVAPKVPGRVKTIYVKEGDKVMQGQLLLELESTEIDAKLAQAKAAKNAALAQSNKAKAGARTEQVQGAYNVWQQAKAASDLANKTYQRINNLYNDKVLPEQKRDEAYTQMEALKKQEQAAHSQYKMAVNGTRIEDKEAATALVAQAEGAIAEVEAYKAGTKVFAPKNTQVETIIPNEGEIVNAGYPVINLIDNSNKWVVFNIREDKLHRFKIGTKFKAIVPALNNQSIELEVTHLNVQADFATWTATKAKGDFDRKTFEAKAYPTTNIPDLLPGMSILIQEKD